MTRTTSNENITEKLVANKLMLEISRGVSAAISQFASWLLLGFSAAFALVLANIATVTNFIEASNLKFSVLTFLISLMLAVFQRWIAGFISAGNLGGDAGEKIDLELNSKGIILKQQVVLSELERATFYPMKWLIKIQFKKIENGDITVGGRQQLKMAQIQGFLMTAQVLLAAISIGILIFGLKV